jgi:hypothetical protein
MPLPRKYLLTASHITPFVALLYAILVDKLHGTGGRPDEGTALEINTLAKDVLPVWGDAVPDLRNIILTILRGKGQADAYAQLGAILKKLVPEGNKDQEVPIADLDILKAFGAYFRTDSPNALNRLLKFASISDSPWVVQKLVPKVGDQQDTKAQLEELINTLVGRTDTALTLEEANRVKATKPEQYATYLGLRRQFNQAWKDALVSFIRKSGEKKVPYQDAVEYLQLNGIDHLMPSGFTGLIDDLQRLYTSKGKAIEGGPNAITFPTVTMNPNYGKADGGDWVFMANRVDGSPGPYFYTSEFKKGQARAKFDHVDQLSKKMPGMQKKWFALVKNFDITKPQCVAAVILEILYEFCARIGSMGNAAGGQSTYGVATLLVKHAIIDPTGNITLRYKGKDGVATKHKLLKSDPNCKWVLLAVHKLLEGKEQKDRIFAYKKGNRNIPIMPMQVNALFRTCGAPAGTTVHKIRTYFGTKIFSELMQEQFAKQKQPQTEKEAMAIFQKMAEAVGTRLNHVRTMAAGGTKVTGTTALSAYIDPSVQLLYWSTLQLRLPKFLEKYSAALGDTK